MTYNLHKNKKGFMIEMLFLVIIGVIVVIVFAGLMFGMGYITDQLTAIENTRTDTFNVSINETMQDTFGYLNSGMDGLRIIAFSIVFGFLIGSMIIAFFSREHPILFFVYFLMLIMFIILSVYISNAYQELQANEVLGDTLASFGIMNNFMERLPFVIAIVGFLNIMVMLVGIIKS